MKIWFMFDNHTFAELTERDADGIAKRAAELFRRDPCGSLFARDEHDRSMESLTLHSRLYPHYGQTDEAIQQWATSAVDAMHAMNDYAI